MRKNYEEQRGCLKAKVSVLTKSHLTKSAIIIMDDAPLKSRNPQTLLHIPIIYRKN